MKSSPILALVCLIGAGVIRICAVSQKGERLEARTESEAIPAVVALETPAEQDAPVPVSEIQAPVRTVRMKVTSYCICEICCEKWSKHAKTATGDDARIYDGVAADPKLLPYRTKLDIPEIGIREVDDTGGAMRQDAKKGIYHIDVRMASHTEARRFGVKWLDVKILN